MFDMEYNDRKSAKEPSLSEMVEKALQILQNKNKRYFLLVEGQSNLRDARLKFDNLRFRWHSSVYFHRKNGDDDFLFSVSKQFLIGRNVLIQIE